MSLNQYLLKAAVAYNRSRMGAGRIATPSMAQRPGLQQLPSQRLTQQPQQSYRMNAPTPVPSPQSSSTPQPAPTVGPRPTYSMSSGPTPVSTPSSTPTVGPNPTYRMATGSQPDNNPSLNTGGISGGVGGSTGATPEERSKHLTAYDAEPEQVKIDRANRVNEQRAKDREWAAKQPQPQPTVARKPMQNPYHPNISRSNAPTSSPTAPMPSQPTYTGKQYSSPSQLNPGSQPNPITSQPSVSSGYSNPSKEGSVRGLNQYLLKAAQEAINSAQPIPGDTGLSSMGQAASTEKSSPSQFVPESPVTGSAPNNPRIPSPRGPVAPNTMPSNMTAPSSMPSSKPSSGSAPSNPPIIRPPSRIPRLQPGYRG